MSFARPLSRALPSALPSALTGSGDGDSPPLDGVSSAVLAFSAARLLRSDYTGNAIRVRRSSDNAEADIGFTGAGVLDQSALLAHVGAGDGFVSVYYEQSGHASASDWSQPVAADQPRIVSAGVVDLHSGFPALFRSATNKYLRASSSWATRPSAADQLIVMTHSSGPICPLGTPSGSVFAVVGQAAAVTSLSAAAGSPDFYLDGVLTAEHGVDTRQDVLDAITAAGLAVWEDRGMDLSDSNFATPRTSYSSPATLRSPEYESERIILTGSADRDAVRTNMANFYGVALP